MSSRLNLETAVQQFGFFCKNSVPTLQTHCCTWLFNQGIQSEWWPNFFPAVLRKHFASRDETSSDRLFLLLSYMCNQSVKFQQNQGRIMEKLLEFLIELLTSDKDADLMKDRLRTSLLPWTLLLISAAFDVIVANKRRSDRWTFLAGEFAIFSSSSISQYNETAKEVLSKHHPLYKLATTKSSVAKAYMKKYADKIDSLMNKPIPPEEKLHELQARLKCLYQIYNGLTQEVEGSQPASSSNDKAPPIVSFEEITGLLDESESKPSSSAPSTSSVQGSTLKPSAIAKETTKKIKIGKLGPPSSSSTVNVATFATGLKRRVPPVLPKPSKDSRSGLMAPGSRIRQYSVRLKLNFSLCTEVVNKLFQLLCHDSITLSSPAQLLACKIIAKIGVHACTFPIPLKVIVDSNLKTLIYNAFNNTENIWFRHAVLCMILDLTDAEIRAISRVTSNLNASASTSALASEPGTTGSGRGVPTTTAELTASSSTENMDTSESLPATTQASAELQIATKRHKSEQDLLLLDQPQSSSTSALELSTEGSRDLSNIKPTDSGLIDSFQKSKFKQIMASYKAMSDDIYMQPISNVTEGHASEQLGLHAYTEYRETVALKDTLARCPPRRAVQQAKVKKPASPEDLALMALIGTSVSTVIDVIKSMIVEINAEMSVNHVERLLAFYWDYISNVNATLASNKCVTQITIPPFTAMAADSLIKYLTTAPMLNEQVWRLTLQTLDSSLRKSPELVPNIIDSVYLLPLMERFMGDSLNKTGNFAFGCAVNKAYMRFIDQLLNYQATETETKFGEKIVASLISVFSLNGPYKFAPYPLDILLEITDKLAADPAKFFSPDSCGDNTIVDLFESVVKFAKTFLSTVDKSARKICDDRYGFTTPVRPNVCFSSFSPSMTPTETPNQPPGLAPPGFSCSKVPVSSTNLIDSEEVMASSNNLSEVECPMPDIPVQQDSMATVDATSNSLEYDSISSVNDFPYIDDVEIFEDDGFDEVINLDRFVKTYQNPNDRIHLDRHETLLSSLFKILGSSMAMSSRNAIKILLTEKPNVVYDLFEILFTCDASTKSVEEISTEHWKVATVGDHILYSLLSISNYAGVDGELSKLLLSAFLDFITRRTKNYGDRLYSSESMRPLELTIPVVYYLSKLLQPLCRKKLFAELGGHIFVSSQLEKGLDASTENWPIGASLTPLARQLAEISNKMTGIELPSIPYPPRATEARFEGLYNFAPLCSATSTSPLAHHLNNLLSASAPHRRARTPIWSYHFPPSQQWLEITLTLPYQVLLSEVNLKAHSQSLGTCPSAIQVEICSEPSLANWLVVGSPMATFGLNRISIPITYSTPINAVRIHLKKPPNSETMSLSQLMLLGVSTKANLHENNNSTTVLINWLAVFNRTLVVEPTVWSYAPSLPEKLAQLFVNRPLPNEVMLSMSQTLTNIDNKAKSGATTIVGLIINYLANSGYVCHTAHSWLVELFFKYCTLTNVPGVSQNTSQSMAVIRQRQLLEGIVTLLDRRNSGSINLNEKTLSSLIWAAACIIWYNLNEEFMRYETIAAVLEVGPKTIDLLLKLALESQSSMLKKSACWLLCSFIRSSRSFMEPILQKLKISTILTSEPSPATLTALGMIAQSGNATFYLHEKNILSDLAQLSIMICKDKMLSKIELLVALVEFFSSLVVIERVRQFLETPLGLEFVRVLMLFIIENSHSILSSINNHMSQLGSYFIELITKCRTHSEIQRQNIAKIMCNLLEYLPSQDFKNTTGLNGALQQMVMKFILEDEHITVRFTDVIDSTATGEIFEEKMRHPMFGCNRNDRVVDLSIYTTCKDLLPVQKRESNMNPSPMPSGNPNVYYANSYSDEVGDSYDAYGFPIYYSKPKQKKKTITSSDQLDTNFITQLLCDNISQRQPLDGECTLEQILQVSKSLSALSSSLGRDHSRFLSNSFAAKPGTSSSTSSSDLSPHDDGYFALTLRIKSLNIQELNQEAISTLFKGGKVSSVSTLQYFARSGGLSILAQHLPVYQHYIQLLLKCDEISNQLNEHKEKQQRQAQPTTAAAAAAQQQLKSKAPLGFVSSANQSSSGWVNSTAYIPPSSAATEVEIYDPESWNEFIAEPGNIATSSSYVGGGGSGVFNIDLLFGSTSNSQTSSAFQPTAIPTISSQAQPSSSEVKTAISSDPNSGLKYKWTTVGGTSSSFLLDDYDFTEVPSIPANNVVFSASASTAAFNPPSGLLHYLTQQMPVNKDAFANKLLTTAIAKTDSIPPHVIIALSIFLRLEGYPELFVTCENRVHAKKLLRVAMGLPSSERSPSDSIAGLRPITKSTIFDTTIMVNPKATVVPSFSPACLHPAVMAKQSIDSEEFTKSNEDEVLALFPFFVLEKLLQYSSPYQIGLQRAQSIRDLALRLGVLDVILLCLSHFAHQESRFETLRPDSMDPPLECVQMIRQALNMSSHLEALKNACDAYVAQNQSSRYHSMFGINGPQNASQAQQDFWVKGTGFGSGTTQQQWNVNQHVAKRRQDEATTRSLLNTIAFFINPKPDPDSTVVPAFDPKNQIELDVRLIQLLNRSCLLKTIHSYLMNDSVLDMSKHADSQLAAITVVLAMATAPPVMGSASVLYGGETEPEMEHDGAKIDLFALLLRDTHFGQTLLSGLQKIGKLVDVYLSKLQKEKKTDKENVSPTTVDSEQEEGEENLYKLSQLVKETSGAVLKRLGEFEQAHTEPVAGPSSRVAGATDELYIESMKPLQFESIPFFEKDGKTLKIPYHYSNSIASAVGQTANLGKRTRRLAQEIVTLSTSLPLSLSSSVFIRASEERLDIMKVLIMGPESTAYSNGCFEFDVWFPANYPNEPMQVNLETTGNQSVRFNPNLYNDGKVCLSILNTWHGRPEERWQPSTSSLLQVIVSIQSLIMVPESFFNEPGYERQRNTPAGIQQAREYDANIRHNTIRWAMVEALRHPPKAFEEVIRRHFWLKRDEICSQITEWINETQTHISDQEENSKTQLNNHLASLKKNFELLKQEFVKMKCPEGLEHVQSAFMEESTKETSSTVTDTSETSTAPAAPTETVTETNPEVVLW